MPLGQFGAVLSVEKVAESNQISLSMFNGFGWSADRTPFVDPDGTRRFIYRYVPPGLWDADVGVMTAMINTAATVYPTFGEYPPELIAAVPVSGTAEFTRAGRAFYESCPIYAELRALEPYFYWDQYVPDGGIAWSAKTNNIKNTWDDAISQWPLSEWAKKSLDPWKDWFIPDPQRGFIAMSMVAPLEQNPEQVADEEGWQKELPLARASVDERTEMPYGLFKVLLASCAVDRVEACKQMQFSETFRLIPCSMVHRTTADGEWEWKEHWVWRYEAPAQQLCRMVKWLEDEEVGHGGIWSVRSIVPAYKWDIADVKFQKEPEKAGWDTVCILFEPLDTLDLGTRLQIEQDISRMPRPWD